MCRRILVVEDDEDVAAILADVLHEEGYEVTLARTGREGLELVGGADEYCLVLIDFRMPDMGGRDFVGRMREGAERRDVPIVLVTGADPAMVRDAGLPVVHKPVGYDDLLAVLTTHCGDAAGEQAEAAPGSRRGAEARAS